MFPEPTSAQLQQNIYTVCNLGLGKQVQVTRPVSLLCFRDMAPIRLAILETDQPLPSVAEKYGTYGEVFKQLLDSGAKSLGKPELSPLSGDGSLEATGWDVVEKVEYPNLKDVDALLMTGSSTSTSLVVSVFTFTLLWAVHCALHLLKFLPSCSFSSPPECSVYSIRGGALVVDRGV